MKPIEYGSPTDGTEEMPVVGPGVDFARYADCCPEGERSEMK